MRQKYNVRIVPENDIRAEKAKTLIDNSFVNGATCFAGVLDQSITNNITHYKQEARKQLASGVTGEQAQMLARDVFGISTESAKVMFDMAIPGTIYEIVVTQDEMGSGGRRFDIYREVRHPLNCEPNGMFWYFWLGKRSS